ncbi:MAG: hypothetical protein A2W35_12040 [Chloroflexi bacterium RBG_16_57_11]|nr:MAG: hypothetical protein A2W35_12040 [Chloroflexi bacterium RBG_16_57_11]
MQWPKIAFRPKYDVVIEETQSICPQCKTLIPALLVEREGKVIMHKRCPEHGEFEALVYGDAAMFQRVAPFNKPGVPPNELTTKVEKGCPWDCGICPEHRQHLCLGIIEVNSACNLDCPLCLADALGPSRAGQGFELTYEQVNFILDRFVITEGQPEVVQFSGGEPSLHPRILEFIALAQAKGISYVMLNTNGIRIARDDRFLEGLAKLKPHIYLQFDGFDPETSLRLRGRADLLETKLKALDRLAEADVRVVLVAAIEYGVNEHEIGRIVEFGIRHPAVFGVSFQSAFRAQRHLPADPLQRITTPDILKAMEGQTSGLLRLSDFVPIPCCSPTCGVATYAMLTGERVIPIPRLVPVEMYLDYITNRSMPSLDQALLYLLERLWSSGAKVGSDQATAFVFEALSRARVPVRMPDPNWTAERCTSCRVGLPISQHQPRDLGRHVFMISVRDFMDPYNFDVKDIHKCCVGVLLPDGRSVPFCAYNSVGYREQVTAQLTRQQLSGGRHVR